MYYKKLEAVTPLADRPRLFEWLAAVVQEAERLTEKGDFDLRMPRELRVVDIDLST